MVEWTYYLHNPTIHVGVPIHNETMNQGLLPILDQTLGAFHFDGGTDAILNFESYRVSELKFNSQTSGV